MDAKISGEFWSDPVIENLPANLKLAALWVLTSSRTTLFGYVEISKKRFAFETGLDESDLESLCHAHPKGFVWASDGDEGICKVWARRYVAHQIGTGDSLVRNRMSWGLIGQLSPYQGDKIFSFVLAEYPELRQRIEETSEETPEGDAMGMGRSKSRSRSRSNKEEVQEKPSGESPALLRARAIFRMRESTPLDAGQSRAWKKNRAAVEATTDADWQVLEWFYRGEGEAFRFRRQDLTQLLNNWNGEIIRAKAAASAAGRLAEFSEKKPGAEPVGWRDALLAENPELNLPDTFEALEPGIQVWAIDLLKKNGGATAKP